MNKLIFRLNQVKNVPLLAFFRAFSTFQKEKHWVLFERGTDARDNAYFFYRYLKEKHPEQKVYYIIDKNSADFHKVKEDAVAFGSLKSYWAIATAEKIISTHCYFGLPYLNGKIYRFCGLYKRFYYLSHGILHNNVDNLRYQYTRAQLCVCGAQPEQEYLINEFGYPSSTAQYTGFARYDSLYDAQTKNQILIMPTWRGYIMDEESFRQSPYFCHWQNFLNSREFHGLLKSSGLQAIFYPHYEMQKYMHLFHSDSEAITLARFEDYDVQTLLKESKVLITDYSSVFFDFAYMEKPVILYQFDFDSFFGEHYGKAYFTYDEMGFGPTCDNEQELLHEIRETVSRNCALQPLYLDRVKTFFPLRDRCNCARIYNAIKSR